MYDCEEEEPFFGMIVLADIHPYRWCKEENKRYDGFTVVTPMIWREISEDEYKLAKECGMK